MLPVYEHLERCILFELSFTMEQKEMSVMYMSTHCKSMMLTQCHMRIQEAIMS